MITNNVKLGSFKFQREITHSCLLKVVGSCHLQLLPTSQGYYLQLFLPFLFVAFTPLDSLSLYTHTFWDTLYVINSFKSELNIAYTTTPCLSSCKISCFFIWVVRKGLSFFLFLINFEILLFYDWLWFVKLLSTIGFWSCT